MPTQTNMIATYLLLVFIWATTPLAIVWSVTDLHPLCSGFAFCICLVVAI